MGTSKSYTAPTTPEWRKLKTNITREARQGRPSTPTMQNIINEYVAAGGGASRISKGRGTFGGAKSAQNVARGIAGFISTVGAQGFHEALRKIGLDSLEGKSVSEISAFLLDVFASSSNTLDDIDARSALSRLMNDLFNGAQTIEDIERIMEEQTQGQHLNDLLFKFFGYYIYEQFSRVFYERLVARVGEDQANRFLNGIRDYVKSALKYKTHGKDIKQIDWDGSEGKKVVDDILQEALDVFGENYAS